MSKLIDLNEIKLETLEQWASWREMSVVRALRKGLSPREAAQELGISHSRLRGVVTELRRKAAKRGIAPEHKLQETPPGFVIDKMTHQFGPEGGIERFWQKTKQEEWQKWQALKAALGELKEEYEGIAQPRAKVAKTPVPKDLLATYVFGDPHIGMFACAKETGDKNWDLGIAERVMVDAVDDLVSRSRPTKQCIVASVGDTAHADNPWNRTMRSGHVLDVDTRYTKIYRTIVRTFIRCIDRALEIHDNVHVISAVGNHDDVTAYTLAVVLDAWYRNEPRVTVDLSPSKFHWYQWGKTFLGFTHGNDLKIQQLAGVMAHDQAEIWGQTTFRHWYTGHRHNQQWWDFPGVTVEVLPTLTPLDHYASSHAYRSRQDMKCDLYHTDGWWVNRHIVNAANLEYAVRGA